MNNWDKEILEKYADRWKVLDDSGRIIKLLSPLEFKKTRKGKKLISYNGGEVVKGETTENDPPVMIFGRYPYGILVEKEKKKKK